MIDKINNKIFTIPSFFSFQECDQYICFSEQIGYDRAKVTMPSGQQKIYKNIRNNDRVVVENKPLSELIFKKAKRYLPNKMEHVQLVGFNELVRFYKYSPTQRFRMHKDGRYRRNSQEESRLTFLIYLNDNFDGGETKFRGNIIIKPNVGMALCFEHELWHEGSAIINGIKYVLRFDVMYG